MIDSVLCKESVEFATKILQLVKKLQAKKEYIISGQIGRSGTSIGANIHEARYAQSKADFVSKLQIALKEANETGYWLTLLLNSEYITEQEYKSYDGACTHLRVLLISSIKTSKRQTE